MTELSPEYAIFVLATVILPIIVGFVTKRDSLGKTKAYVLLALAAVNSFVLQLQTANDFNGDTILNFAVGAIVSFVIAAGTHAGFLKPAHVTGEEGVVNNTAPDKGIG